MNIKKTAAPVKPKALIGSTGMTELLYRGHSEGIITWYGPVTQTPYKAGRGKPRIFVDNRDVAQALGDWKEKDTTVFVKAPPRPAIKPAPLPPVVKQELPIVTEPIQPSKPAPIYSEPTPTLPNVEVTIEVVDDSTDDDLVNATDTARQLAEERNVLIADVQAWLGDFTKKVGKRDVQRYLDSIGNTGSI